jgi:Flp pilus assembly protein TadG
MKKPDQATQIKCRTGSETGTGFGKRTGKRSGRNRRGASLVEAIVGFVVIIPIGLAAVDVAVLISASQTNEQIAEQAARAAGCQRSEKGAQKAAEESVSQTQLTNMITQLTCDPVVYDLTSGQVTVFINMQVTMPVPMPFLNQFDLRAGSIQPIVAFPASQ